MMHYHAHAHCCSHTLIHCKVCDVVYCSICGIEWKRTYRGQWSYTAVIGPMTTGPTDPAESCENVGCTHK